MIGNLRGLSFISFLSYVQIEMESRVMVFGSYKIIGHFSKLVNFKPNFEDLNGFNCKNSKLRDCIYLQYLPKFYSFVSKFKNMRKL